MKKTTILLFSLYTLAFVSANSMDTRNEEDILREKYNHCICRTFDNAIVLSKKVSEAYCEFLLDTPYTCRTFTQEEQSLTHEETFDIIKTVADNFTIEDLSKLYTLHSLEGFESLTHQIALLITPPFTLIKKSFERYDSPLPDLPYKAFMGPMLSNIEPFRFLIIIHALPSAHYIEEQQKQSTWEGTIPDSVWVDIVKGKYNKTSPCFFTPEQINHISIQLVYCMTEKIATETPFILEKINEFQEKYPTLKERFDSQVKELQATRLTYLMNELSLSQK